MFERLFQIKPSYLPVVRCPDLRGRPLLEVAAVSRDVASEVEPLDHVLVPGDGEQLGAVVRILGAELMMNILKMFSGFKK